MENDQKTTILNVDDDDAGRYSISRTLHQAGFDVKEASNGKEALRFAEEQPDLIVLDVNLPDINGFEVCRMIKNNPLTSRIPVLHLSATYLDVESKVKGLETADGYLTQPVEPPVLISTIKALLRMKRAEEEIRKLNQFLEAIIDNANVWLDVLDEKANVTIWNKAAEMISGYSREEVIGHGKIWEWLYPDEKYRKDITTKAAAIIQKGEIVEDFETIVRTKNGEEKIISWHSKNLVNEKGVPIGSIALGRNITERKRAEEEQKRLLAELEAKNRELESFVYTVSHDLKAPLVSLNGFSGALQKEYKSQLGEEGRHYLERIQANVAHMESLIKSLLELSRIGQVVGAIEEIDVAVLLRKIRDELAVRLKEAGAEFVVQEPLPTVCADRGRIHQVFVNLIENAVKFRSAERALRIEVGCRQESGFYRFHVADNGIGIAPQYHEQIFNPFQKLHPEIEGVGIGLALVKKIVEHHGGLVWVESPSACLKAGDEGAGATFYFTLPIERGV